MTRSKPGRVVRAPRGTVRNGPLGEGWGYLRKMLLLALVSAAPLAGCTAKVWYEGFQSQQRTACDKYPQRYEVQRCLDKLNNLPYDQYKNQLDGLKAKR